MLRYIAVNSNDHLLSHDSPKSKSLILSQTSESSIRKGMRSKSKFALGSEGKLREGQVIDSQFTF